MGESEIRPAAERRLHLVPPQSEIPIRSGRRPATEDGGVRIKSEQVPLPLHRTPHYRKDRWWCHLGGIPFETPVIPAKAGIQVVDPRLRGGNNERPASPRLRVQVVSPGIATAATPS
jgi:hypothetical protein